MSLIIDKKYSSKEILDKRMMVRELLLKQSCNITNGTLSKVSPLDLDLLFSFYDKVFFDSYFADNFKGTIKFSLSTRMTRAAAKTIHPRNLPALEEQWQIEIRVGTNFFFEYYELSRNKKVGGIMTRDSLEAFQIVFEHELCHFIELILYRETNCSRERFKKIANGVFGHIDSYHNLPTNHEIAYNKYGFRVGDFVLFYLNNKALKGFIYKINKRATVMVEDSKGGFADQKGVRYSKYYVPLELLKSDD